MTLENDPTTPDFRMQNKTKPIHEVRLGAIKAAVWRNDTDSGVRSHDELPAGPRQATLPLKLTTD